ncbi:class I SAM-dependent methyltransferase [Mycobacterium sp. URHB0044]|uniref:class I SAM-dependent methyltransferase n=1 Tax=Mycobacterium sp. URHB0044 TaxID=1380386 RepID=UPI0006862706|nr:methyltransferase domain-containing protein [Mycobacterium sp. URHB0044]
MAKLSGKDPFSDQTALATLQSSLAKVSEPDQATIAELVKQHVDFATSYPSDLRPGGRVLDFGCGIGDSVRALLDMGFDAWGVDVLEFWDRDIEILWEEREKPPSEIAARLKTVSLDDYRLPFPDAHFDFCISDQVIEHVFNLPQVMQEIVRVLRPGAVSVHRFPGPNHPIEGHISVPVIPLCRFRWYLALWAWLGVRSPRQKGLGWRETLALNVETMRFCSYPTKKALRRAAREANVTIEFHEGEGIKRQNVGRAYALFRAAETIGLGRAALSLLSLISQRYVLIKG